MAAEFLKGFLHRKKESNASDAAIDDDSSLSTDFGRIHLGTPPHRRTQSQSTNGTSFVGGFTVDDYSRVANHGSAVNSFHTPSHGAPGPLPTPPRVQMPVPQVSRTMQYAEASVNGAPPPLPPKNQAGLPIPRPQIPTRPYSDQPSTPPRTRPTGLLATPATEPGPSTRLSTSAPSTPTPKRGRRASSSPDSDSGQPKEKVQCSGITKAGTRCSRQVKIPSALQVENESDDDGEYQLYCHQHSAEILSVGGFYTRGKVKKFIVFDDYIMAYLQEDTQLALRSEMEKRISKSDTEGYIYVYEIRDKKKPGVVQLKVGRAVNLVKRIDQWCKQCGSKQQVLRGYWPSGMKDDDTMMRGRVMAGDPGPWCHRLERLMHIELTDLTTNAPYLHPKFPAVKAADLPAPSKKAGKREKCPDCGAMHKEIFSFELPDGDDRVLTVYEDIVRPALERWGEFVKLLA